MATIPMPNPGGNNQTSPIASPIMKAGAFQGGNVQIPGAPTAGSGANPFIPPTTTSPGSTFSTPTPGSPAAGGIPNVGGLDPSSSNSFGSQGGLNKQLEDIYGKGVGGSLAKLLEGMSGTDSQILQEFIQSLGPQFAQQAAGVQARLGAGGVSSNSSVSAIAQSNLAAQESSDIAAESAKLTQSQEMLTADILTGMQGAAAKEVATSGWSIFGDVMNQITGDIGNMAHGGNYHTPGNVPSGDNQGSTTGQFENLPQLDPNIADQIFPVAA